MIFFFGSIGKIRGSVHLCEMDGVCCCVNDDVYARGEAEAESLWMSLRGYLDGYNKVEPVDQENKNGVHELAPDHNIIYTDHATPIRRTSIYNSLDENLQSLHDLRSVLLEGATEQGMDFFAKNQLPHLCRNPAERICRRQLIL